MHYIIKVLRSTNEVYHKTEVYASIIYIFYVERREGLYKKFKQLLEERNITAYRVWKDTGIPQSTLSDWKSGRSTPKVDKLIKIANYFEVPLEELLKEEE